MLRLPWLFKLITFILSFCKILFMIQVVSTQIQREINRNTIKPNFPSYIQQICILLIHSSTFYSKLRGFNVVIWFIVTEAYGIKYCQHKFNRTHQSCFRKPDYVTRNSTIIIFTYFC